MKREVLITIYHSDKSGGTPELWHADQSPQGTDGELDLAHAMQGFPITARITRGEDTRAVRLTLDEALELRDALDMVRHLNSIRRRAGPA
jgi:hypothetical protein